ncbi:hypothetical protein [Azotobacter beijerinckii]|uniref:hypothetical protein n=1 Tax=Azotobacter beijerinckii TaxID=170623 RepID=UPI001113F677|nr:hypothetical protein [Azotobacter beijerinckii]
MAVNKRKSSWWDSLYIGRDLSLSQLSWDFTNNKGPANGIFLSDELSKQILAKKPQYLSAKTSDLQTVTSLEGLTKKILALGSATF